MKESTHLQVKGYPGLDGTAEFIMPLIPSSKVYVEVFAGMGRTVEVDKHEEIILNDMSDYAVAHLKEKFPTSTVTQDDYFDVIKRHYKNPDAFLFMDPPWRKNIYKNNEHPEFTEKSPIDYYDNILFKMEFAECKWILCVDQDEHEIGKRVSKSRWTNKVITHPTKKLYGRSIAVRMCSNMW